MTSKAEEILSRALRVTLAEISTGANIPCTELFQKEFLGGLEWWLPGILEEVYPEWNGMTLDGVFAALARKTGDREAELLGQCIFIEDQTLALMYVRLQIAPIRDEVSWLECKVGERRVGRAGETGKHEMMLLPYSEKALFTNDKRWFRLLYGNQDQIDWVYKVTFGDRHIDQPFDALPKQ